MPATPKAEKLSAFIARFMDAKKKPPARMALSYSEAKRQSKERK